MTTRVAVFVDGENVSADHAPRIRAVADALGSPEIVRVYGNAAILPKWDGMPGFRFIHSGTGKNATDILLTVQAMEAALSEAFAAMVIASSDRDFTHLVTRIRELGVEVVGLGEAKAAEQFRLACTRFEVMATPEAKPAPGSHMLTQAQRPEIDLTEVCELDMKIKDVIRANSRNGQGVQIQQLATLMHGQHQIRIKDQNESTWRSYLGKRPALFDLDPKGPEAKVRFKPTGFAGKS
jgi:NYN domain